MRNLVWIIIMSVVLISCSKKEDETPLSGLDDCVKQFMTDNNLKAIPSSQADCIYYSIWQYQGAFYYEYNCCVCDLIPRILKCNGDVYISDYEQIAHFKEKAILYDSVLISN
ncbi:MAG: hypothetical protein J5I59_10505 [Saprospiraceae bacterium]|nr:hypothetical protein [Saprospiraceae bacterium]